MLRRFVLATTFVASAGLLGLASERATLILTDGERKSGPLAFHGENHETIINNMFQLNTDDGKEIQLPLDQVAVIDFSNAGRPPASEVQALPSDNNSQVLVMRNGSVQRGKLLNLIGGNTVEWQDEGQQKQRYPISDVARIYLNPTGARTALNYGNGKRAVATTGQALGANAIQVNGNMPWTDTGITVNAGDRLAFQASGQVAFGRSPGQSAGPEGVSGQTNPSYPVSNQSAGMLIGRVNNGAPFAIGNNTQPISMPASGRLYLGINDNELGDNSGAFSVTIRKQ